MKNIDTIILPVLRNYHKSIDFLEREFSSRTLLSRLYREDCIRREGMVLRKSMALSQGDEVEIFFPDEEISIPPVPFSQEILHEDEDLLVVNKAPGLAIMPCRTHPDHTFANEIAGYFLDHEIRRKIRLLGRLDRDTSGVMIVCKNPYALMKLEGNHTSRKVYHAIISGNLQEEVMVDAPIGLGEDTMVRQVLPDGKEAKSRFYPILPGAAYSLIGAQLFTGRTHQIRCHLRYLDRPILGDDLYGSEFSLAGMFLHVRSLSIEHPRSGVEMTFTAPYPKEMKDFISQELLQL